MSAQKREEIAAAEKFSRVFFANSKENLILDRNLKNLDRGERAVVSTISTNQKILYRRFHRKITQTRLSSARAIGGKTAERELQQISGGGQGASAVIPGRAIMTPEDAVLTKIWKTGSLALQNSPDRQLPLLSPDVPDGGGGRKQLPALPSKIPLPKVRAKSSLGDTSEMSSARNVRSVRSEVSSLKSEDSSKLPSARRAKSSKSECTPPKSGDCSEKSSARCAKSVKSDLSSSRAILPLTARGSESSGMSVGSSWRPSTAGETLNIRLTMSAKGKRSVQQSPRSLHVHVPTGQRLLIQTPASQRDGMSRLARLKDSSSFETPRDSPRDVLSVEGTSNGDDKSSATQPRTSIARTDGESVLTGTRDVTPQDEKPTSFTPDGHSGGKYQESDAPQDAELKSMCFTNRPKFGRGLNKAVNKRDRVNNFGISLKPAVPKTNRAVHQQEENFVIKLLKKQLKKTIKDNRVTPQLAKVEEVASAEENSNKHEDGPRTHDPEDKAVLTIRPRTAHELSRNSSVPRIGSNQVPPGLGNNFPNAGGDKKGGSIVKDNPPLPLPLSSEMLFNRGDGTNSMAQSPYVRPHNNQFMLGSPRLPPTSGSARSKSRAMCETQRERVRSARYEVRIRDFCDGLDPYKLDRERQIKDYYFVSLLPNKPGMTPTATDVRGSSSLTSPRRDVIGRASDSQSEGGAAVLPSESEMMKYGGDMNIRNMTFKVLNWDFSKKRRRDPTHCK